MNYYLEKFLNMKGTIPSIVILIALGIWKTIDLIIYLLKHTKFI
jgi:hypothetical protein